MIERSIVAEKRPTWELFHPDWWHQHGLKMHVNPVETSPDQVVINSHAARLIMTGLASDLRTTETIWVAQWEVAQCFPTDEVHRGRIRMGTPTLRAAFGLENTTDEYSKWLIERFGGTCAEQGRFIRYRDYLNIPCPGIGHDGDPNLSLELDDEIRDAIAELIISHNEPLNNQEYLARIARRSSLGNVRVAKPYHRIFGLTEPS